MSSGRQSSQPFLSFNTISPYVRLRTQTALRQTIGPQRTEELFRSVASPGPSGIVVILPRAPNIMRGGIVPQCVLNDCSLRACSPRVKFTIICSSITVICLHLFHFFELETSLRLENDSLNSYMYLVVNRCTGFPHASRKQRRQLL